MDEQMSVFLSSISWTIFAVAITPCYRLCLPRTSRFCLKIDVQIYCYLFILLETSSMGGTNGRQRKAGIDIDIDISFYLLYIFALLYTCYIGRAAGGAAGCCQASAQWSVNLLYRHGMACLWLLSVQLNLIVGSIFFLSSPRSILNIVHLFISSAVGIDGYLRKRTSFALLSIFPSVHRRYR